MPRRNLVTIVSTKSNSALRRLVSCLQSSAVLHINVANTNTKKPTRHEEEIIRGIKPANKKRSPDSARLSAGISIVVVCTGIGVNPAARLDPLPVGTNNMSACGVRCGCG